jgi:alanine racemase
MRMPNSCATTRALIDLSALQHNLRRVREAAPGKRIMAIIKADAYGHGLIRIARALASGVNSLGVARLEEAVRLRDAGIRESITLLEGFLEAAELAVIVQQRLNVVVHRPEQIAILEQASLDVQGSTNVAGGRTPGATTQPLGVWLKVDTGMHRLGIAPAEAKFAWQRLQSCSGIETLGVMTHLANADDRGDNFTLRQLECFTEMTAGIDTPCSIANSAGILGWPASHADWVRPGIMLYGVSPFTGGHGEQEGLQPVMTLCSRLIAVNRLHKGDAVGYGGSWTCPEDMPVGIVAIGYGDGYPRHTESGTPVLVNGRRVPLIGRVSMDMITVDLRSQPQARVGDPVVLWGKGLPVEEIARYASTISYELLCGVARRVEFVEITKEPQNNST